MDDSCNPSNPFSMSAHATLPFPFQFVTGVPAGHHRFLSGQFGFGTATTQKNLVVTSRVLRQSFTEVQSFVGSVEPTRQSIIGSAVAGRVSGPFPAG